MVKLLTFKTEHELVKAIDELKLQGIQTEDMTVIRNERPIGPFKKYKNVEFVKGDGSIWEKFVGKMFNSKSEDLISRRFKLNEDNQSEYNHALNNGDFILLMPENSNIDTKQLSPHYYDTSNHNLNNEQDTKEDKTYQRVVIRPVDDDYKTTTKHENELLLEDKDFENILNNYGLNSERDFMNKEKQQEQK